MKFPKKTMEELQRLEATQQLHKTEKFPITILLDGIRSMNNVGSIFRTADATNIEQIILTGLTPQPPHRDIQKTALGATESVAWTYASDIATVIHQLKEQAYTIIGIEQVHNSTPLHHFELQTNQKIAIILGNEVTGVSDEALELCDMCIEIPQFGSKHSFNVAVTTGILCWHLIQQQIQ